jgi:hypothetical protein
MLAPTLNYNCIHYLHVDFMSGILMNEIPHLSRFLTVAEVVPGSSAQSSDVQRGDLILLINNRG